MKKWTGLVRVIGSDKLKKLTRHELPPIRGRSKMSKLTNYFKKGVTNSWIYYLLKTRYSFMAFTSVSMLYLLFSLLVVKDIPTDIEEENYVETELEEEDNAPSYLSPIMMGTISGNVFHDFDVDGTKDANETFGEAGITVTAIGADGMTASTTTDAFGDYTITLANGSFPARIEFSNLPSYLTTTGGATSGTTVQFVSNTAATGVDLGVVYIDRYIQQNNPRYAVGCFTNGDPLHSSNTSSESVVSVEYNDSGAAPVMSKQTVWTMSEVGPLWGLTVDQRTETLYGSAILKRHVGLGPDGIGAIYMKDFNAASNPGTPANIFYDFGTAADDAMNPVPDNDTRFPYGPDPMDADYDLEKRLTGDNDDPDVFDLIGKRGLGGLDLSEDGSTMYVINLYDRQLYSIGTNSPAPGSATALGGLWLTSSPCTNGIARPFAVKVYRGKVYVGVICDGSSSACAVSDTPCNDLTAEVYEYDIAGGTWSNALSSSIDLNYQRSVWAEGSGYWQKWIDTWAEMNTTFMMSSGGNTQISGNTDFQLAQPILADIEFRDDGAMVLFFLDRTTLQLGYRAPAPNDPLSSIVEQYFAFGDILVAGHDGMGTFTLENNGSFNLPTGAVTGTQAVTPAGPGGREFYADSWAIGTSDANAGGLAILPGSGQTLLASSDLVNFYSAGVMYLGNTDGIVDKNLEIYAAPAFDDPGGTFAKAGGLSDLEFLAEVAPKQVGNRIWKDADNDGIQDPGEDGVNGVVVELWKETAPATYTQVASTTSAADADQGNGYFLFSNNSVGSQTWMNGETQVEPDMNYEIRVSLANVTAADASCTAFTTANAGSDSSNDPNTDVTDSDGVVNTGVATIAFNSGAYGVNNHSLDLGAISCPTISASSNGPLCVDETLNLSLTVTGSTTAPVNYSWTGPDGFSSSNQNPSIANVTTAMAGTYNVTLTDGAGCSASTSVSVQITQPTSSAANNGPLCEGETLNLTGSSMGGAGTVNYSWSGPDGFSSSDQNPILNNVTTAAAGVYSLVVTDANSCTSTTATTTLVVNSNPVVTPVPAVVSRCIGETVTVNGTPSGGSGSYTSHSWAVSNPGTTGMTNANLSNANTQSVTVNTAGLTPGVATIAYTVTDDSGCSNTTVGSVSITVNGFDYGDLPDPTYPTLLANSGPSHCVPVVPELYFGSDVDVDSDGQQSSMSNGDDADGNDDEDGITLVTPLIPGYQACVDIEVVVPAMTTAYVQGWIDFGGDGTLDAGDQIASDLVVTTSTTVNHCFNVPANATFDGGMAMMRYRISTTSGLGTTGSAPDGEVEDYKFPLAKVGNLVWEDRNFDGVQGLAADEPGLNGITINLIWEGPDGDISNTGDNETYSVTSANVGGKDGIYYFCGLIAGEYSIDVMTDRFQTTLGMGTQFTDSNDGVNGTSVVISNVTTLTTAENGTSDMPGMINNFPNNQDDQSFDFGYTGLDWGDLPDAFGTTMANSGAVHSWKPGLYLGSCVDFETDGAVDPEAGTDGTGGDDNTAGLFTDGTCATAGDDEDGVRLLTPMIPGNEACIEVTATSTTGTAVLNAWIDFNGDGDFAGDPNEFVLFTTVDGGALTSVNGPIPNGTSTQTFCFDVPATATFDGGETHMRYRLSMNGTNSYNGLVTSGEVEDYYYPLAKIGNLVWEDYSFDGVQDTGEPGIENVEVQLTWAGPDNDLAMTADNVVYTTMTDMNGNYYFCGLVPSNYEVAVVSPGGLTPTDANNGNDDFDDSDYMSQVVNITDPINLPTSEDGLTDNPGGIDNYPDANDDLSVDFGFVQLDFGDLPDGFGTLDATGAALHVILPDFYLGDCVDPETDGTPDPVAGDTGNGDDGNDTGFGHGTCNVEGDENGIDFITPMVPGHTACIEVTSTIPMGGGILNAWIDFNGNDQFDAGEQVEFTSIGGVSVAATTEGGLPAGTQTTEMCFTVPATASFEGEETHLRFRLSSAGGLLPVGLAADGEVEDYYLPMAKLGNFVWEDVNGNGIQDMGEPGIGGVTVTLDATDANGMPYQATYTTLPNGYYGFCGLLPTADMMSPYKLTFASPGADWIATAQDSPINHGIMGNDTNDSDVDPAMLMITNISLNDTENDPTLDAGFLVLPELGDYVWLDMDNGVGEDGEQQVNELPVVGAKLTLTGTDALGRPVMQMLTTGSMGEYLFDNLWPGDYCVQIDVSMITAPVELVPYADLLIFTLQNATGDAVDSDVDPGNYDSPVGKTAVYNLESQESELTVDGGILVPCLPPSDLMAEDIMLDMFTLSWQVNNDPINGIDVTNHCWNIEVGGAGFNVGLDEAIIQVTVCEWEPEVTVIGDRVYYTVQGLVAGTCYDAYVAETCDGVAPPPNTMGWTMNAVSFCTYDDPPTASFIAAAPSCPMISPGYMPDGSFDLTINDGASCTGTTYDVSITPVLNSAPDGSTPPLPTPNNLTDVMAGVHNFIDAGAGVYEISITETGPCNQKPSLVPVVINVLVPDAIDADPPTKLVTNLLGVEVMNIGPFVLPEGACEEEYVLFVQGSDSCDGMITAADAVTATAVTVPASIDPGTQVSVTPDGLGNYMVNVSFSVGTTTLTIGISDASGNVTEMEYTVVVQNNAAATIIADPVNASIPVCEESVNVVYGFSITDACQLDIDPASVNFTANGSEVLISNDPETGYFEYLVSVDISDDATNWTVEYSDVFGQTYSANPSVSVTELAEDMDPIIIAADENVTITACETTGFVTYSFMILDDCDDIVLGDIQFDDDESGLTFNSFVDPADGSNSVFVVFEGQVEPGDYYPTITYQGITLQPLVSVTQDEDQPAEITMPGNLNFTLPLCESGAEVTMSIQIEDDCDDPIGNAEFTLDGNPLTPSFTDGNGYFEFIVPITIANNGSLLIATYTDGADNETEVDALITVNAAEDIWAPIIVYPSSFLHAEIDHCVEDLAQVCFEVTVTDNCSGDIEPDVVITPTPENLTIIPGIGGYTYCADLSAGIYSVDISATDDAGNMRVEDFSIVVTENQVVETNLACNNNLNVTLNDDCQAIVSADMVLDGNFGCLTEDDFDIVVIDDNPYNGNIIDGCGEFVYEIRLADGVDANFTMCWGYITTEDKTDPEIVCPDDTDEAIVQRPVQHLSGSLDAGDASLNLPFHSCFLELANPPIGAHYYELRTFTVTQTDIYTFDMATTWGDGVAALYAGNFDVDQPCANIIAHSDDVVGPGPFIFFQGIGAGVLDFDALFRMSLPLQAGQTYTLLTSSWPVEATGDYTWAVYSDNGGRISGVPVSSETIVYDLICEDLDYILIEDESYIVDGSGTIQDISNSLLQKLTYTGFPDVSDNCGDVRVTISDTYVENGDCGNIVVTRTFEIEDKVNSDCTGAPNTASCQQTITLRKATVEDVIFPPLTVSVECDEQIQFDENGHPHPASSGYPFIQTAFGFHDLDQTYCNLGASYSDEPVVQYCEGTFNVRREWNLLDWCRPGDNRIINQLIQISDYSAPEMTCPIVDWNQDGVHDGGIMTFSTSPFDCTASFEAPMPTVVDNCSSWEVLTEVVTDVEEDILNQYGQVVGTQIVTQVVATIEPNAPNRYIGGIPVGCHRFRYTATDACGNYSVIECNFCVEDQIEPTAICDDDLNITLSGSGNFSRVYAEDIDEGSNDNCGEVTLEVRRLITTDANCNPIAPYYTAWGPYVDFSCCDVGQLVTIELRATDGSGNSNICWLEVEVEDKINPICLAPHDVSIACDELPYGFDAYDVEQLEGLFGGAEATDNCMATWEELPPLVNFNDCGNGSIIRRFRAIDSFGNTSTNTCNQIVTVGAEHNYEIKFPRDASADCGIVDPGVVEYNELSCDLLAVSSTDEFFSASGDECYKIIRTHRVINWCEYDGISNPIVISRNEDCDVQPGDEDVWVLVRPNGVTYVDRDNNEHNNDPLFGTSRCTNLPKPNGHWANSTINTELNSVGFWEYAQHIRVYDDKAPTVSFEIPEPFCSINGYTCRGAVDYPINITEECTPNDLTISVYLDAAADGVIDGDVTASLSGTYPNYNITGDYPIGDHAFVVVASDGCGNTDQFTLHFQVVDCLAPVPICINGLALELMPVEPDTDVNGDGIYDLGAIDIWATDFIASPNPDCSGPVTYSMNIVGQTPDQNATSLILTCDDLGTVLVEIYAWDSAYNPYAVQPNGTLGGPNYDHCQTYILVQDNMFNTCNQPGPGMIAGTLTTEYGDALEGSTVYLSGASYQNTTTGTDGYYDFSGLETGYDYTVAPTLEENPLNGVSTLDMIFISKHILGVDPLDSPYKMIAADVNNSESISTLDLIHLRKLILSVDLEFANNSSWRFVRSDYVFPDPTDPWAESFPEIINVNDLNLPLSGQDFVAIKVGDVNGSAQANSLMTLDNRTNGDYFKFEVDEAELKAGQTYEVVFKAGAIEAIEGYQFTLNFDTDILEFMDIDYAQIKAENFGWRFLDEGMITTSWNEQSSTVDAEEALFSLHFKARRSGRLSEVLSTSSRYLKAEAYEQSGALLDVAIDFGSQTLAKEPYELYQNVPNPFVDQTRISFYLPEATTATLQIVDTKGRVLKLVRGDFAKGVNHIDIQSDELPASGVLFYTLTTEAFTATKSMILVE